MKRKQPVRKAISAKKTQDIDRSFIVIPEVAPDQWRESLEVFFDENEAGQDHVRHLTEISKADIDHYYFTDGYDLSQISPRRPDLSQRPKISPTPVMRMGDVTPVYEGTGCFRYAMP
jgi:nitrate reductase cytochrome c-type subunit